MRHGSFKGPPINDLLKLVNSLFGQEIVPESEYLFKKLFEHSLTIEIHFFCLKCDSNFGFLLWIVNEKASRADS